MHGVKHGPWVESNGREKGSYVHGVKDGPWIEWLEVIPGTLIVPDDHEHDWELRTWDDASGSYVDGKRHGDWELSKNNEDDIEKKYYDVNWMRWKGPFVDGKPHGVWRQEASDGTIKGCYYQEGKKRDCWLYKDGLGNTYDGPIVVGKKHGVWNEFYFLTEDHTLYIEGSYVNGRRQGQWNIYRLSDRNKKVRGGGLYVNGKKIGPWVEYRNTNGKKTKYNYGGY